MKICPKCNRDGEADRIESYGECEVCIVDSILAKPKPRLAHDWQEVSQGISGMFNHGKRKCNNCGKEQVKEAQQNWGRVTGYRWGPLVGRCKLYTTQRG